MVGTERGVRAVAVQEVFGSQEIVLKDTGAYVEKPAGILGVTVLGDGSIAPVIDLPQLLRSAPLASSVQPASAGERAIGWIGIESGRWPVYCVDGAFAPARPAPERRRMVALLDRGERCFGVLSDDVRPIPGASVALHRLPAAMRLPDSPLLGLLVRGESAIALSGAGAMLRRLSGLQPEAVE
jgi:CheW-like domain